MYGEPRRKNVPFFQFLSIVHAKVANSNQKNYIFLRSTINTLSIEHIKNLFFLNLKIGLECLLLLFLLQFMHGLWSIYRHSSIRDFLIKKFSFFLRPHTKRKKSGLGTRLNRTLAQNNNSCLTWDCSVVRAPMRMKIAVGIFHMLIIMKILVLSCALHISTFCVVL